MSTAWLELQVKGIKDVGEQKANLGECKTVIVIEKSQQRQSFIRFLSSIESIGIQDSRSSYKDERY